MSKGIDFIQTNLLNLTVILRPSVRKNQKADKKGGSIQIQRSFKPQQKSSINQALRPQIDKLKEQYKKHLLEEKRKNAELAEGKITREQRPQQRIQEESGKVEGNVVIGEGGEVRDEHGNVLFMKNRRTDLLINRKKDEEAKFKDLVKLQRVKQTQKLTKSFLDLNLIVGSSKRRVRRSMLGLQFLEKGSYQTTQHKAEVKNEVEDLNEVFEGKQPEQNLRVIKKRQRVNLQFNRQVPQVEWWDQALLSGKIYSELLKTSEEQEEGKQKMLQEVNWLECIKWEGIRGECQYQKVGDSDQNNRIVLPMFLTKDQRKKLKRKRKQEKLQEKNDKIKLGLIEPDKPKLRVGNMAIVMKNQFIIDPSKIQAEAQKQTQERISKHMEANSTRKLTKTQKKDKAIRKLKRDSAKECRRAVFKVGKLTDPTHIFKVNMNAKQLALSGFVVKPSNQLSSFPTLVLVEGGLRAVKFYKNLMLRRIRWSDSHPSNECKLIWEGQIQGSSAGKWRMQEVGDEVEAIRWLTEKKLQNFWEYMTTS